MKLVFVSSDRTGVLETGCWPGITQAWALRLGITTRQQRGLAIDQGEHAPLFGVSATARREGHVPTWLSGEGR